MRTIFIDSLHLIALLMKDDQWHGICLQTLESIGDSASFVTTYEVLTETLAGVSRGRPEVRLAAVQMVYNIMSDPNITLIPQTLELFTRGLQLYASRPDKRYSLTDCISMTVMREQNITEALTHDRDFESEGFTRLIR